MSANLAILAEVPLFQLMDDEERAALAGLLELRSYTRGETIFNYGDPGEALFVVRSGSVEVYVDNNEGDRIMLAEALPGEMFGDISMLDGGSRTATAVAMQDSVCLSLDRDGLLALITKHPHAGMDLLSVMGRRLRATDELLRTHVTRNLNDEEEERLTTGQRVADRVATFGGSWTFIILFGVLMAAWVALNSLVLARRAFDPYPYIFLNLVLSMLAAIQAPVIMMSQNRQAAKDRIKGELDFKVNLKAELEVAQLHNKVDRIYSEMQANFARVHKNGGAAKELAH